jgi:4-amino-4-deoxy-L-arabinose transferase-like glycosyltransferase
VSKKKKKGAKKDKSQAATNKTRKPGQHIGETSVSTFTKEGIIRIRTHKQWLLFLFLLCIAVLYLGILFKVTLSEQITWDDAIYLSIAEQILKTGKPIRPTLSGAIFNSHPPLGPYLLALPVALFGKDQAMLRLSGFIMFWIPLLLAATLYLRYYVKGPAWIMLPFVWIGFPPFVMLWPDSSPVKLDMPLALFYFLGAAGLWVAMVPLVDNRGNTPRNDLSTVTRGGQVLIATLVVAAILTKATGVLLPLSAAMFLIMCGIASRDARMIVLATRKYWLIAAVATTMLVGWAILMTMLRDDYWSAYVYQFRRFFVESYAPPAECPARKELSDFSRL